jgi:hypothetical protein
MFLLEETQDWAESLTEPEKFPSAGTKHQFPADLDHRRHKHCQPYHQASNKFFRRNFSKVPKVVPKWRFFVTMLSLFVY